MKSWTKASGKFNQFKLIHLDPKGLTARTIRVDNSDEVEALTDETRFDKLSETLQLAQSKNIPIFILTNNPMGSNQKNLFVEVFAELGVDVPIKHILRGGSNGPKGKGITIIQNIIIVFIIQIIKIQFMNIASILLNSYH